MLQLADTANLRTLIIRDVPALWSLDDLTIWPRPQIVADLCPSSLSGNKRVSKGHQDRRVTNAFRGRTRNRGPSGLTLNEDLIE